jgi:hypothetical protein
MDKYRFVEEMLARQYSSTFSDRHFRDAYGTGRVGRGGPAESVLSDGDAAKGIDGCWSGSSR